MNEADFIVTMVAIPFIAIFVIIFFETSRKTKQWKNLSHNKPNSEGEKQ